MSIAGCMTAPDAEASTASTGADRSDLLERPGGEFRRLSRLTPAEPPGQEATPDVLGVVGQSAAVRRVLDQVRQVASTDSTVLLLGETGTGKELFATRVHQLSARRVRPMVKVNCAAIPDTLIESELFGREKGAFTGALARQIGRFELADHSTIFLDEIGDLAPDTQVKLLRVLEEKEIERLGSPRSVRVDTRIIAATHRDLECRVAEGRFREDLYYRLNVFPIRVPALRERKEDIPLLVWWFVDEFSKAFGKRIDTIGRQNMAALQDYPWPGNIRELRNVVERAMIAATGNQLTLCLPQTPTGLGPRSVKLMDVEREHILRVLERTNWRIRGAGAAADQLGLKPTTLETRMAKLGLRRPLAVFAKHGHRAQPDRNLASTRSVALEDGSNKSLGPGALE
jgi:transcriptional regulator with GAF, ATPase, and Fis domain